MHAWWCMADDPSALRCEKRGHCLCIYCMFMVLISCAILCFRSDASHLTTLPITPYVAGPACRGYRCRAAAFAFGMEGDQMRRFHALLLPPRSPPMCYLMPAAEPVAIRFYVNGVMDGKSAMRSQELICFALFDLSTSDGACSTACWGRPS